MTHLRQYDLARLTSRAWPRCDYRLVRVPRGRGDAPAVYDVHNATRRMGVLTVRATGAQYRGATTPELDAALAAVRAAIANACSPCADTSSGDTQCS